MRGLVMLHTIAAATLLSLSGVNGGIVELEIVEPSDVANQFPEKRIQGADAPFSTPDEERSFLGYLSRPSSAGNNYCSAGDYSLPASSEKQIVVLSRGVCKVAEKVKIAQEKGAYGVVLVDNTDASVADLRSMGLIDETPSSGVINIPCMIITKADGSKLIDAMNKLSSGKQASAEFLWSYVKRETPEVEYWFVPGDSESDDFLEEFADLALALGPKMDFKPHPYIFRLTSDSTSSCWQRGSEFFCTTAPSSYGPGVGTGEGMVREAVRRMCLHDTSIVKDGETNALYSEPFWQYTKSHRETCKSSIASGLDAQEDCSLNLLVSSGGNREAVTNCVEARASYILQQALLRPGDGLRSVKLNGDSYHSTHTGRDFGWRVCHTYPVFQDECRDFLKKFGYNLGGGGGGGLEWYIWFIIAIAIVLFFVLLYLLYRFVIVKHLRKEMRYEVMSEVRQQMNPQQSDGTNEAAPAGAPGATPSTPPAVKSADDDLAKGASGKGGKEDNPFTIQRADTSADILEDAGPSDEGPGPDV